MNRQTIFMCAVASTVVLAGCGGTSDTESTTATSNSVNVSSVAVPADTTPTAQFGATQEVISEGFAVGVSDYTVSNPRVEGSQYVVDVAIDTKQGNCIPGVFAVLTGQGSKIESTDSSDPASFDGAGTMIAGEKRNGAVYFDVPAGSDIAKFVLYHGTMNPPKAYWTP